MRKSKNPHHFNHRQQPPLHHHNNNYSDYENTLIQEVLYLHSLWHTGPPSKKPKPDNPWPIPPQPYSSSGSGSTWPAFPTQNKPITRPATLNERAKLIGIKTQLNAIDSCLAQFKPGNGNGSGDDKDENDDEDEDEVDDGDDEEEREFFEDLFTVDRELRGFYKENCDGNGKKGEFYCLVCGLIGKSKSGVGVGGGGGGGKKYRNCVALVQHSMMVSRTKKRKSHRAYGTVVCKVLGWDVHSLPSVDNVKSKVKNEDPTVSNMETSAVLANLTQTERETIPSAFETDNIASTNAGCPTFTNMETGVVLAKPTQTERETIPSALETDNVASTNAGCPTFANMETSVVLAKPTQTDRETIPTALETDNVASTNVGCIATVLTHVQSEFKNHADEDPIVAKMETSVVLAKPTETEGETIPGKLEKDNVASTNAECIATELTDVEGVIGDASLSHIEPEGIPDVFEKNNVASTDTGCIVSAATCIESERKGCAGGFKVDNHDSEKDIVCSNPENIVPPQQNNPDLDNQKAVKDVGEGLLDNKQCEPSLVENDPYKQLQCLPGVFQIPE